MVCHGEAWCGADQAKKPTPHLKTGSPVNWFDGGLYKWCGLEMNKLKS